MAVALPDNNEAQDSALTLIRIICTDKEFGSGEIGTTTFIFMIDVYLWFWVVEKQMSIAGLMCWSRVSCIE